MSKNFRTCLFGGFDREDVVSYIEQAARENREKIEALEKSNEELQREKDAMTQEISALRSAAVACTANADATAELRAKVEALTQRASALEEEAQRLRPVAEEYNMLKNYIAQIEINAIRRTEAFRAEAVERLRSIVGEQQTWCAEQKEQYTALQEEVCRAFQNAQDTVRQIGLNGFDEMADKLRQLDQSFDEEK